MIFILSKKGFDSSNGGIPSPAFAPTKNEKGEEHYYPYLSLPIPYSENYCGPKGNKLTYSEITKELVLPGQKKQMSHLICDLIGRKYLWVNEKSSTRCVCDAYCHYDPMLDRWWKKGKEDDGFEAGLGQTGSFASSIDDVLSKNDGKEDVVFLFWGLFHEATWDNENEAYTFIDGNDFYAIWGFMKICGAIRTIQELQDHQFIKEHHAHVEMLPDGVVPKAKQEVIYYSTEGNDWIGDESFPHYGVFSYDPKDRDKNEGLILSTKEGTRPREWKLPPCFNGSLSHQESKADANGREDTPFTISKRAQECVLTGENYGDCNSYLSNIFKHGIDTMQPDKTNS